MTMYRRAIMPGSVQEYTQDEVSGAHDSMVLCRACSRIIPSRQNLKDGHICPFCHHDINKVLNNEILDDDLISDDGEVIAIAC